MKKLLLVLVWGILLTGVAGAQAQTENASDVGRLEFCDANGSLSFNLDGIEITAIRDLIEIQGAREVRDDPNEGRSLTAGEKEGRWEAKMEKEQKIYNERKIKGEKLDSDLKVGLKYTCIIGGTILSTVAPAVPTVIKGIGFAIGVTATINSCNDAQTETWRRRGRKVDD